MTADIVRPVGTMKTTGIPADATPATATTATAAGATIMVPLVAIDTMMIAMERETGMKTVITGTVHPAMTVMTGEDGGVVTEGEVGVILPQSTAHRLQKVLFHFPSASALPLVGTCTPLDMNGIQLCKPKQQVSPQLPSADMT
jgi:hypothetical protein